MNSPSSSGAPLTAGQWQPYPSDDPFAGFVGPLYQLAMDDPGEPARIGFLIAEHHCNPMGNCHGGMLATMLDLGLGLVAIRAAQATNQSPTIHMSVDFMRGAHCGQWVESRGRLVHSTARLLFAEGSLVTATGPVVRASAIYRRGR